MAAAIRHARAGEEERILPLYQWLFNEPGYVPAGWDPQRARRALAAAIGADSSAVLVVDDSDELVGICTAYLELDSVRYGKRCWVEDLAVHPERRSGGWGGRLLDAAGDWAREHGATHIELDTGLARADAQRFYERRDPDSVGYSYSWRL
jgi:GNAT superfamily N-acetyltransferase